MPTKTTKTTKKTTRKPPTKRGRARIRYFYGTPKRDDGYYTGPVRVTEVIHAYRQVSDEVREADTAAGWAARELREAKSALRDVPSDSSRSAYRAASDRFLAALARDTEAEDLAVRLSGEKSALQDLLRALDVPVMAWI